jgi:hypothetical protein
MKDNGCECKLARAKLERNGGDENTMKRLDSTLMFDILIFEPGSS